MLGVEGDVVHIVVRRLTDLSAMLAGVGEHCAPFPLPHGRGDEFHHGGSPDQRDQPPAAQKARNIYIPDLSLEAIRVEAREFR